MPTGYTFKIGYDSYPFEEFVWDCAKNFGAFSHMRDEPYGAKISFPKESTYYQDRLDESRLELERFEAMTLEEAQIECDKYYEEIQISHRAHLAANKIEIEKFRAMRDKVNAWIPPTADHVELKDFMLQQLGETLYYNNTAFYYENALLEPKQSPQDWIDAGIDQCRWDVIRYTRSAQEEQKRYIENIEWINRLMESVPLPENKK